MITKKIETALSQQVNAELYSSYLYLSMQAYFQELNLTGFSNWMSIQTKEELVHATKIYNFINERGAKVTLTAIDCPPTDWKSPLEVFQVTYEHEQKVTGLINDLVNLAIEEKDHATNTFLQWFVNEQVEEEASALEVLQKLKLVKDDSSGLFMIDNDLAQRVFTPPVVE